MRSPYHLGMRKREATGFVVLCLLLGSFWIPKQVLLGEMPLLLVAAIWTWAVMASALAAAAVLRVRWPRLREWRALFVVSVLMLIVPQGMMYLALQHMQFTPLMAETLRAGGPLFLVTMTPFLKSKSVPRSAVHWMIVGFGGVLLLFDQALQIGWQNAPGMAVAVGALLMASGGLLYAKRTLQHISPVLGTGLLLVLPSLVLIPLSVHSLHGDSSDVDQRDGAGDSSALRGRSGGQCAGDVADAAYGPVSVDDGARGRADGDDDRKLVDTGRAAEHGDDRGGGADGAERDHGVAHAAR